MNFWRVFFLLLLIPNLMNAQSPNCVIYNHILKDISEKYTNVDFGYEGFIKPEDSTMGTPTSIKGNKINFFVVNRKAIFNINDVKYWFSQLVGDTTLLKAKFYTDSNRIFKCTFEDAIKFQFCNYSDEKKFSMNDYIAIRKGDSIINYTPMKVIFSNILYYNNYNKAIVFVKTFVGVGHNEIMYGYQLIKRKKMWVITKMEVETR